MGLVCIIFSTYWNGTFVSFVQRSQVMIDSRENAQRAKEPILPALHVPQDALIEFQSKEKRSETAGFHKKCQRSPCEDALQDRELDGVPLWIEWSKSHVPQARMLQDLKQVLYAFQEACLTVKFS